MRTNIIFISFGENWIQVLNSPQSTHVALSTKDSSICYPNTCSSMQTFRNVQFCMYLEQGKSVYLSTRFLTSVNFTESV